MAKRVAAARLRRSAMRLPYWAYVGAEMPATIRPIGLRTKEQNTLGLASLVDHKRTGLSPYRGAAQVQREPHVEGPALPLGWRMLRVDRIVVIDRPFREFADRLF